MVRQLKLRPSALVLFGVITLGVLPRALFAETLADIEGGQAKSRQAFIDHFSKFTQDKNVLTKPIDPEGKASQGGRKTRFNRDDEGPYQSDLTYHDFSYAVIDEAFAAAQQAAAQQGQNQNGPKSRVNPENVSMHGPLADSSILERAVYQLNDQFKKEEDNAEKQRLDEQKGIKYRGLFKEETRQVIKDGNGGIAAAPSPSPSPSGGPSNNNANQQETFEVKREWIREEGMPKVAEVGKNSFDTIDEAAKEDGTQSDKSNLMGTISMYYTAANKAFESLWRSSLSNLGQKRANRAVDDEVKLNEDAPRAEDWAQERIAEINKDANLSDDAKQRKVKEVQKQVEETKKVLKADFRMINPTLEQPEGGSGDQPRELKEGDVLKENARERDWRVYLEMQDKVGIKAQDVKSNWQYSQQDNKNKVTTQYDDKGNPAGTEDLSMDEQLNRFNDSVKSAAQKFEQAKSRIPTLDGTAKEILQNQLPIGELSATEIVQYPQAAAYEGYEVPIKNNFKPAQNYEQLVDGK